LTLEQVSAKACDAIARLHLLQKKKHVSLHLLFVQALLEALVQEDVLPRAVKDSLSAS
jgi:hypothetical protein